MPRDAQLKKAFVKGLGVSSNAPIETFEFSKTEHWDSIGHMKLIAAIEEEFLIQLDVNDILGMSSYTIAKEIIQKYLDHQK
jgi:acyl carrier protein